MNNPCITREQTVNKRGGLCVDVTAFVPKLGGWPRRAGKPTISSFLQRTPDTDEINKRRLRARKEQFSIANTDPQDPIFSNFRVKSGSDSTYSVEIRDVQQRQFACDCVDFLNPAVLGPLFRFNRDFYELDDRGRPEGYRNLGKLHECIRPCMLRRRKAGVETELPERTDQNNFVPMSDGQKASYDHHESVASKLMHAATQPPLRKEEQEKLQRELAMMRMICDSNYILDPQDRVCPKLGELEEILEECRGNEAKVIIFSEWERMLQLARELCERMDLGFAWHTGSVPQLRRPAEINAFKNDPECRVFLSTDSGATGLNLQNASVAINCDLP